MNQTVLIIGASSGIAQAVARSYAAEKAILLLVARNPDKLGILQADLLARGAAQVHTYVLDASNTDQLPAMAGWAWSQSQAIDVALIAHGTLPNQAQAESDLNYSVEQFRTNGESVIHCMAVIATRLEQQGRGVLAVIGSVAGDRGRGINYVYGAAKAAIAAYAGGLRARLFKKGVHVLLIKPGFVATAMTAGLNLPPALTASPERVALDIRRGISRQRNVLYTPWFWLGIMGIIQHIPEALFKRLKL